MISIVKGSTILHPSVAAVAKIEKSLLNAIAFIFPSLWITPLLICCPVSEKWTTYPLFVPRKILSLSAYHIAFSDRHLEVSLS